MIMLIGSQEDPTMLYFKEFLESKEAKYFFLDQHLLSQDKINLFSDHLTSQNSKHYYAEFSGALNRMSYADLTGLSSLAISKEQRLATMLNYIVTYKIKNVLNQSYFSISNDSKLLQLELIRNHIKHIKVPESIVLKNVIIDDTLKQNSKFSTHIVKSLSSIRSIVKIFEGNDADFAMKKSYEPVMFQQYLEGINVRVHVVGQDTCAIKIYSNTVDYRYENTLIKFEHTSLPKDIEQECLQIAEVLNLKFAGIDLLLTHCGQYYVFEVNPSPGYSYFEKGIDSKFISEKILQILSI